jgi:hypothetical protein
VPFGPLAHYVRLVLAAGRRPCRRRAALRPARFPLRLGCRPDHPPTIRPVTEVVCFPAGPGLPSPLTSVRDQPGPARSAIRFRPAPRGVSAPGGNPAPYRRLPMALRPGQQARAEAPSRSSPGSAGLYGSRPRRRPAAPLWRQRRRFRRLPSFTGKSRQPPDYPQLRANFFQEFFTAPPPRSRLVARRLGIMVTGHSMATVIRAFIRSRTRPEAAVQRTQSKEPSPKNTQEPRCR